MYSVTTGAISPGTSWKVQVARGGSRVVLTTTLVVSMSNLAAQAAPWSSHTGIAACTTSIQTRKPTRLRPSSVQWRRRPSAVQVRRCRFSP